MDTETTTPTPETADPASHTVQLACDKCGTPGLVHHYECTPATMSVHDITEQPIPAATLCQTHYDDQELRDAAEAAALDSRYGPDVATWEPTEGYAEAPCTACGVTTAPGTLLVHHAPASGTQLYGSSRGDGTNLVLRGCPGPWRWSKTLGRFYVRQSRDRRPDRYRIQHTADALRAAGHTVAVLYGQDRRDVAEREEDKRDRSESRAEHLRGRAEKRQAEGDAQWDAGMAILEHIPAGQPILVDHYSAPRHRRALERVDRAHTRASEAWDGAKSDQYRADATEANTRHRESAGTTRRRIERLEAEQRRAQRGIDEHQPWTTPEQRASAVAHWTPIRDDLERELVHWREHLAALEASGVKLWSREDFTKGDRVHTQFGWWPVLRVNAKSLTIPHPLSERLGTTTVPYDQVQGRRGPAEAAPATAEEVPAE